MNTAWFVLLSISHYCWSCDLQPIRCSEFGQVMVALNRLMYT